MLQKRLFLVPCLIQLTLLWTATAVPGQEEAEPLYQLETVVVTAPRIPSMTTPLTQDEMLDDTRNLNAGQVIDEIPGVSSACASIDTPESVVRGLGWERVATQVDFLPIYGSCPARMDPPTVYLAPEAIENLIVVKGLPSVTYGPGGTGGRIMARTVPHPAEPALDGAAAHASTTWNGGREGMTGRAGGRIGNGTVEGGASFNATHLDDYESGDGKTVPAENRSQGGGATFRWTPTDDSGYWFNWNTHKIDHLSYPALPMDATDVESHTFTFGSRHEGFNRSLEAVEWQAGYSTIDHVMDNATKPSRVISENEAVTESETIGLRMETEWAFNPDIDWVFGADTHYLTRDALRERIRVSDGATFYDPIWPDASQGMAGFFAERTARFQNDGRLRLGLRLDGVTSAIGKGDEPLDPPAGNIAPTVRDAYVYYYGEDARDTDRNELLVSGNALWEMPAGENLMWFTGAGWVQRAASITERFYVFAPAPGGYLVGNPSLDPETKFEVDIGTHYHGDRLELGTQLFCAYVWDYILETGIATETIGEVRGFVNTDALLGGGELDGRYRLSQSWSIPFGAAYVRGYNTSDSRDLPLIPPLNGYAGIRWEWDRSVRPWAEAMVRAATRQDRIDPQFPETETAGYQVLGLRGGIQLPAGFSLQVGVENLLDQDYTEHLNRTVPLDVGDLTAGEKIPMPGRYFYASISWVM